MMKFSLLPFFFLCFLSFAAAQKEAIDIYALDSVRELRIYLEYENWDDILDSLKQAGEDERLVGDVVFAGQRFEGAGIRYKGNSSYFSARKSDYSKLPFNINLKTTDKDNELPGGYTKLKLSNVFRDPSFLREALAYYVANQYMISSRANFVRLYINDRYFGLYTNVESVEDELLSRHFDEHKGPLFKCDPVWEHKPSSDCPEGEKSSLQYLGDSPDCYKNNYEPKSKRCDWDELIRLTNILNNQPDQLESVLAVDEALWMLAFNNTLVNLDSYTGRLCHNYYLYQDEDGIFRPIIWDLNLAFGGFRYDGLGKPLKLEDMQSMSAFVHYKEQNEKRPLITQLLANELYRKMYIAHIQTIVKDFFVDSTFLNKALEMQKIIYPYVKADTNRLYEFEGFKRNLYETANADKTPIVGIMELMDARSKYLSRHPLLSKAAPRIEQVKYLDMDQEVAFTAQLEGATRAWLFYRHKRNGSFFRQEMFDDGSSMDEMQADNIYGTVLKWAEKDTPIEYFIVAENDHTAALSPERASFEFHTTAPKPK